MVASALSGESGASQEYCLWAALRMACFSQHLFDIFWNKVQGELLARLDNYLWNHVDDANP